MLTKSELYAAFRNGAEAGGANLLPLSNVDDFPRDYVATFDDGASVRVRIYIWNCRLDATNQRSRVQLTTVPGDVVLDVPGSETFVLGYDEDRDVFGAVRRSGPVGSSPSVYFSDESLDEAKINGLSMMEGSRRKLVTFRSDFTAAFLRSHADMFAIAGKEAGRRTLQRLGKTALDDEDEPPSTGTSMRRIRETVVQQAVRSSTFATRVLSAYGHACAMCGLQLGLIDAAHIVPVNAPGSDDRTDNGLALCALHHRAYDGGLVLVKPDYTIMLGETRRSELSRLSRMSGVEKFKKNLRATLAVPSAVKKRPSSDKLERGMRIRSGT